MIKDDSLMLRFEGVNNMIRKKDRIDKGAKNEVIP